MVEMPLREQVVYYRRRAAEYDVTAYGELAEADEWIAEVTGLVRPCGDVLEIACGTGRWTEKLARTARSVTAVDSAPEMIDVARGRVGPGPVEFVEADVFGWVPPRRFDLVFFAFWLSHVPDAAFDRFWELVDGALADGGRAVFVDDQVGAAEEETYVEGSPEIVERRLTDGSRHLLVKVFREPPELETRLAGLGWQASVRPCGHRWLLGEARRSRRHRI